MGQAGLPTPRELLSSLPPLSLPAYLPTQKHLLKNKIKKKQERKKATTVSGLQIQQAKYTASIVGKGPPPSLAGQQPQSLIYIVHKPRALHNQNEAPLPRTTMWSTPVSPPQSREGTGKKGEKETDS